MGDHNTTVDVPATQSEHWAGAATAHVEAAVDSRVTAAPGSPVDAVEQQLKNAGERCAILVAGVSTLETSRPSRQQVQALLERVLGGRARSSHQLVKIAPLDYLLVLPDAGRAEALITAGDLYLRMQTEWPRSDSKNPIVNIGVARYPHDATTGRDLIQIACDRLDSARRTGAPVIAGSVDAWMSR